MSDYLTSLAARAVDAAAAIRPRVASVYEPPPVNEATPEFQTAEPPGETTPRAHLVTPAPELVMRHEPPQPPRTEVVHETTEKRVEVRHEVERRLVTEAPPAQKTVEVHERVSAPVTPPAATKHAIEPAAVPQRPSVRPATEAPKPIAPRERVPERVEKVVERIRETAPPLPPEQRTLVERIVETNTVEPAAPPQIIERRVDIPRAPVPSPERTVREIRTESLHQPSTRITVAPQIVAQPKPVIVEKREREEPQPDSEPSIHVTIGRIEVRAVPAEEPARRPAAPAAERVSLDDYLRRRSERPRR